ncbi:uncharacterized protein LOC115245258 isoform X1 [Formica exsecta]|uniref:uncharacterized protein LOC115245258 isoform X1 n=2 Tax=Formica exsecta TaxID=72781 RepID=UPI00114308C2|nr:uncharacterized protein LOC115245258 isoform X1 [Formica exsecta]
MFARCIKITPLLFLGCIVAQSIWLIEGTMPNDEIIKGHRLVTKMLWSDPTTLDSKIILPSNLDQRKYPIWKIRMYHGLEISPLEIRPLPTKEDDGEKPRGQQVGTGDKVSRREVPRVNVEVGTDSGDHRERNYVRVAQGEISRATNERNPPTKEEKEIDLSFLDDLGGLASFLPDAENSNTHTLLNEEASSGYSGFFDWFMSKLRGTSVIDETKEDEGSSDPRFVGLTSSNTPKKPAKTKMPRRQYAFVLSTNVDPNI